MIDKKEGKEGDRGERKKEEEWRTIYSICLFRQDLSDDRQE